MDEFDEYINELTEGVPEESDYDAQRAEEYPSIKEQLDMMYHDSINGTTTWVDMITNIKNAHPKPTE